MTIARGLKIRLATSCVLALSMAVPSHVPAVAVFTPDGKKAYVSNVRDGTLSVIDVSWGEVVGTVPNLPRAIVLGITKDGEKVYVTQGFQNHYAVVAVRDDRILLSAQAGKDAHSVALTPDGRFAWIVNRLSSDISVVDTHTDWIVRTILNVGNKPDILLSAF